MTNDWIQKQLDIYNAIECLLKERYLSAAEYKEKIERLSYNWAGAMAIELEKRKKEGIDYD